MLSIKELDYHAFQKVFEPEIAGFPDDVTLGGKSIAKRLKTEMSRVGLNLSPDSRYLALAAGQAHRELAFASELGIGHNNVVLVDRKYYEGDQRWFRNFPDVKAVQSGLFQFLEQPPERNYSLVSVFGIEYVLDNEERMKALISLLPNVLKQQGLACIYCYDGESMTDCWQKNGFKPIYNPEALPCYPIIYSFDPQ